MAEKLKNTKAKPGIHPEVLKSLTDYVEKLDLGPQADLFDEGDEAGRHAAQDAPTAAEDTAAENARRLKGGIKQLAH